MVGPAGPETDAGPVVEPQPAPFGLPLWDLQPLPPPDALHPLCVHVPAFGSQQCRDAAIAVSAILHRQADDRSRQCRFVISATRTPKLGRAMLANDQASPSFRDGPDPLGDDRCVAGGGRGLGVSLDHLFEDQLVQRQIRDRLAETAILPLKLLQALGLIDAKTAIPLRPANGMDGSPSSYCQKLVTVVFRRRVRSAFLRP